jgi:2-phospho-L-lactate/phosphoenolpyruvate guanylyltransferase
MKVIVIPVKAFAQAKSRLAACLSAKALAELAEAMCADVFDAVAAVRSIERVCVVTNEPLAMRWAWARGWEVLAEERQISESASVDAACRHCETNKVAAVLRLPGDIPLVRAADIEAIFAAIDESRGCVIVPSRDGTGTNALLRSPPTAFASHFGSGSFAKHLAAARAADIPVTILRNPRIELDVDEADDLELLRQAVPVNSRAGVWFSERDRDLSAGSDPALCHQVLSAQSRG